MTGSAAAEPPSDCSLCPRLVDYLAVWRAREPSWFCRPTASFGPLSARLLIVGLAPGLRGANRTGRAFTGDASGAYLYPALAQHGFATKSYAGEPDDGLEMIDAMVTNAVRCAPPENKPTSAEIAACRPYLLERIASLPRLRVILALGRVAHDSVVRALGAKLKQWPFGHGAVHELPHPTDNRTIALQDSYHCSKYNRQTGVLTDAMFHDVLGAVRERLDVDGDASR